MLTRTWFVLSLAALVGPAELAGQRASAMDGDDAEAGLARMREALAACSTL